MEYYKKLILGYVLFYYYHWVYHPFKLKIFYKIRKWLGTNAVIIPFKNKKILVKLSDYVDFELFVRGDFEPYVLDTLITNLDNGDENKSYVLWDIGAHIGSFSLKASSYKIFREIVAFEPNPKTYQIAKYNFDLNGIDITLLPVGLGIKDEKLKLYEPKSNNASAYSLIKSEHHKDDFFEVFVETGITVIQKYGVKIPDVIKIDVEGNEYNVLKGIESIFKNSPPKLIAFEALVDSDLKIKDIKLVDFLQQFNYSIELLNRQDSVFTSNLNFIAILNPQS